MRRFPFLIVALMLVMSATPVGVARARVDGVSGRGCLNGIQAWVTETDPAAPPPVVDWRLGDMGGDARPRGWVPNPNAGSQAREYIYWIPVGLYPTGEATGTLRARGAVGESYGSFKVDTDCPPLGSVRGVAFEDVNRNGWLDGGEPLITSASWKLTGGGDWHICGFVGSDASYGPTVLPGTYYVVPIAQPGWRVTTPVRAAGVRELGSAALGFNLGFVRDPSSRGDSCSQYTPVSGVPPAVPGIPPSEWPIPPTAPPPSESIPGTTVTGASLSATLRAYGIFNTLLTASQSGRALEALHTSRGLTLFAPTDAAFARMRPGSLNALLSNPRELDRFVKCHAVSGAVPTPRPGASTTHRTVCGTYVTLRNTNGILSVTGGAFASASGAIATATGVIYPVDAVLFTSRAP